MAGSENPERPFGLTKPLGALRWVDRLVVAYTLLASVPAGIGAARGIPGCVGQLFANAAILASIALLCRLSRRSRNRPLIFLRLAYAPIMFLFFYRQTGALWPALHGGAFDPWVAGLEECIFGFQPALRFAPFLPNAWAGELLSFAYFAYYCFTPILILTVLFNRGYEAAERVVTATALCFFACYTFFWLFPVVGPFYWFAPYHGPELSSGWIFNHVIFFFTSRGEVATGAFPSSHLAVAVLQTLYARRFAPRLFPFMLIVTILMVPAVVYLRAHYVVDVPIGILVGLLFAVPELKRRKSAQEASVGGIQR
ncbi:MAG: phosphatase PAP2 family protein [Pseudomonadota bacterium]